MKAKLLLLPTVLLFFASILNAQVTDMTFLQGQWSGASNVFCDSIEVNISPVGPDLASTADRNFHIVGINLLNKTYTATVTWADSSVTVHTGTSVSDSVAIVWAPAIADNITISGFNLVNILLVENASNDSIATTFNFYGNACEAIAINGSWDCDGDGIIDSAAVINQVYLYSATDTISSVYVGWGTDTAYFPSIPSGTYTVGADDITFWLNGVPQPVQSITPSTLTFPLVGPTPTINIIYNCANQTCFNVVAFCDDNNNGLFDSLTESPIPNLPLNSTTTDSSGQATVHYANPYSNVSGAAFNISYSWLTNNNYISPSNSSYYSVDSTYLDSNCASVNTFNIPLYCNLTTADSVCFDGTTFNDLNVNGIFDTGEPAIANVLLHLVIDNDTITLLSNANGYYSYNGLHVGGASSISIEGQPTWLTNNNFSNNFLGAVSNYSCGSVNNKDLAFIDPNANSITAIVSNFQSSYAVCDSVTLSLSPIGMDTTVNEDIDLYFSGTNLLNESYSLQVDWGDNIITSHNGSAVSAGSAIIWMPQLNHVYAVDSVYSITLTLTKMSNQNTQQQVIQNVNSSLCSDFMLLIQNSVDCDADGINDGLINIQGGNWSFGYSIPVSAIYLFSGTDTVFAESYINGMVAWPDTIVVSNYSLGILQSYLDAFDLVLNVNSAPNSISMPYFGPIQTVVSTYNCIPDSVCLNGYVYCDDNGNGVMDANETGIPNVPIDVDSDILHSGYYNDNDTTDSVGYYDFSFTVYDTGYFQLELDQTWLTANGYVVPNSNFNLNFPSYNNTDSLFDCATHFNIPIICNATATDSICVNGQLFCDINNNGTLDSNETLIPNAPVTISDASGGFLSTTFTDSLGNYSYHNYHPNTDSVEVTVSSWWLTNNGYNSISPITVSTLDCSIDTDIAIDCNIPLPCDNTWINMSAAGPYYQNWTNTMVLSFGNSDYLFPGSIYTISIIIPNGSTLDSASFSMPGYTINGDTLSWTQTINGFDSLNIDFNIAAAIPDSTLHPYQVSISGPNLDCDSTNNTMTYTAVVGNSFDPNNKLVNLPEFIDPDVQEVLYYTVNFQNTGTAPAQDVFIEDQLSPYLDWSTLEVLSKSHSMYYTVDPTGMLVFTFPQIWLPDSTTNEPLSKGYINFKIKESATIQLNETIENTAYIYFDFNAPIITNTTRNTNVESGLGLNDFKQPAEITVFPNPSTGVFNLSSSATINSVAIYDLMGKLVYDASVSDNFLTLDLIELSKGMYQIKVDTDNGTNIEKLILK